jgi:DNA-binding NarL/FixJ family response regulator
VSIRVLLADDQALVRGGLRKIVETEPDMAVVAEAADGLQAVDAARASRPDVARARHPHAAPGRHRGGAADHRAAGPGGARVLMLTTFGLDDYVFSALRAGASGFMLKDARPRSWSRRSASWRAAPRCSRRAVTRAVIEEFARHPAGAPSGSPRLDELTAREREVLMLLCRGRSNSEIAADLVVSEATAKTHVARVLMKLGVRDRVQAVIFAYEAGLVAPGSQPA